MKKIPELSFEWQKGGGLLLEQDHYDGNGTHWVEVHPAHLQALLEGRTPDVLSRLLLITDRMEVLQDELKEIELQPYRQPDELGRVILEDLMQLLEDLGAPVDLVDPSIGRKKETQQKPTGNPAGTERKPMGNPVDSQPELALEGSPA